MSEAIQKSLSLIAAQQPGAVAISTVRGQWTYSELEVFFEALAELIAQTGVARKSIVGVAAPRGPLGALFAIAASRHYTALPIPAGTTANATISLLSDLQVPCVVAEASQVGAIEAAEALGIGLVVLSSSGQAIRVNVQGQNPGKQLAMASVALIVPTSGSTGRPKYVPLTHENITAATRGIIECYGLSPLDRCLNLMPLFHVHGLISASLATLLSGGTVICADGLDSSHIIQVINEWLPTWWTGIPALYEALLAADESDALLRDEIVSNTRFLRVSSAPFTNALRLKLRDRGFACPLVHSYGLTETASLICSLPLQSDDAKCESVGLPVGAAIRLVSTDGQILGKERRGEIQVQGPSVMSGYINGGDCESPFAAGPGNWLRTGDEGFFDTDGYLHITARYKLLIRRGGRSISPLEVERVVCNLDDVSDCVVVSVPHPTLGEDLVCLVTLRRDSSDMYVTRLRLKLFDSLNGYKVPSALVAVPSIPKNAVGKTDRTAARREIMRSKIYDSLVFDKTPLEGTIEQTLHELWRNCLGKDSPAVIGANTNLLLVGADPLRARAVSLEVASRMNASLTSKQFFMFPTIRMQRMQIEAQSKGDVTDACVLDYRD
ncbi:AMP-binding protein [Burkholderia gladioli]|uniref:AMP-binding protein n=1 Tax=Burkholderia gladioli TaxID=28095 RepID=UPI00163ED80D|nr:AMP-binding protein [Burkholderia gladioli]